MVNNLFSFATSELSQDAVISWLLNCFNDSSNEKLQEMAGRIIEKMTGIKEVDSVDVITQYSKKVEVDKPGTGSKCEDKSDSDTNKENVSSSKKNTETIAVKIDVLLIVNGSTAVIIEDKVNTSEHDDQINRYQKGLAKIIENHKDKVLETRVGDFTIEPESIKTVYWKTGFIYDDDKLVNADVFIDCEWICNLLRDYTSESEVIKMFYLHLQEMEEWNRIHCVYWAVDEQSRENGHCRLNIAQHQLAQYTLMREFFDESLWKRQTGSIYEKYKVYSESSSGRPFTEMAVFHGTVYEDDDFAEVDGTDNAEDKKHEYSIFWRIDTDAKAPYLSLRLYERDYSKKKGTSSDYHNDLWNVIKAQLEKIVNEIAEDDKYDILWEMVDPGYRANYKEAAVFHYRFTDDIRSEWDVKKHDVIKMIRLVNTRFVEWAGENLIESQV